MQASTSTAVLQAWGRQLAEHRHSLGLSQAAVAAEAGVDQKTVSNLERGIGDLGRLIDVAAAVDLVLVEVPA